MPWKSLFLNLGSSHTTSNSNSNNQAPPPQPPPSPPQPPAQLTGHPQTPSAANEKPPLLDTARTSPSSPNLHPPASAAVLLTSTPGHASTRNLIPTTTTTTTTSTTLPGTRAGTLSEASADNANGTVDAALETGEVDSASASTSDFDDIDNDINVDSNNPHDDSDELHFHFQFDELPSSDHPDGQHRASIEVNPASAMDHGLSAANESADERTPESDPDGDEAQLARHTDGHEGCEPDGPETAPGAEADHQQKSVHHTDPISSPSSLPLPDSLPSADAPPPNPYQCTPSATRCNPNQQRGTSITNPITTDTPTHDCNDHERQETIDSEIHDNEAAAAEDYHIHEHGHCATEADVIPPPSSTAPTVSGGAATTSTAVVAAAAADAPADATADATSTTMTMTPLPLASDIANHHDGDFASAAQESDSSSHPASAPHTSSHQAAAFTTTKSTTPTTAAPNTAGLGDQTLEQRPQQRQQQQQPFTHFPPHLSQHAQAPQQQQQQQQQISPHRQPTPRKRRFSLMRFRHASESHLSTVVSSGSPSPYAPDNNAPSSSASTRPASRTDLHDNGSAKSPASGAAGGSRSGRKSEGDGINSSSRHVPADADAPPVPPVPPLPAMQVLVPNGWMQPPPTIITTSPTAGANGAFSNGGRYYGSLNALNDTQSLSQPGALPATQQQQQQQQHQQQQQRQLQQQPSHSPSPSPAPSQWNLAAQWARYQQTRMREKEEREREKAEQHAAQQAAQYQRSTGSFDANATLSSDGTYVRAGTTERGQGESERDADRDKDLPRPLSRSRKLLSTSFTSGTSSTIRGKSPRPPTAGEWTSPGSGPQTVRETGGSASSRHSFSIPFPSFSRMRNGDHSNNNDNNTTARAHSYRDDTPPDQRNAHDSWTMQGERSTSFDDRRLSVVNLRHGGTGPGQDTETLKHGPVVPGRLSTSSTRSDRSRGIGGSRSFECEREGGASGRGKSQGSSSIGQGLAQLFSSNNNSNGNGNTNATADGSPSPFKSNPFSRFARKKRAKTLFPLPARVNGNGPPAVGFGGGGSSAPSSGATSAAISPDNGTPITGSPPQNPSSANGSILGNLSLSLGKSKGRQMQSNNLDRSIGPVDEQAGGSDGGSPSRSLSAEPPSFLAEDSPTKAASNVFFGTSQSAHSMRIHTPSPTRQAGIAAPASTSGMSPASHHQPQNNTSNASPLHPSVSALFRKDSTRSSGASLKSVRSLRAPGSAHQHMATPSGQGSEKSSAGRASNMRRMRSSTVGSMPIPWFGHGGEKHVQIATQTHPKSKSERNSAESEGRGQGDRYSDEAKRQSGYQAQHSIDAVSAMTPDSTQRAMQGGASRVMTSSPSPTPTGNGPSLSPGSGARAPLYNNGSTGSRKSFGDFFHLPTRGRQNSEPLRFLPEGHGLPIANEQGHGHAASPGTPSTIPSKPNSMSLLREPPPPPPAREEDDTPATYLLKLESSVPRGSIATILSQSNDEFYKEALRKYMNGFSFFDDPIDMSLRKMLMEVELPKETQEIDRVLQSFAERYHECNPGIFEGEDQAYFIAFSLLILHTDVFNKNNKRKMQRADYVRNTRDDIIADEILECFYENISYTPFIHVEDDTTLNTKSLTPSTSTQLRKKLFRVGSADHLSKSSKDPVDPYALILEGKLWTLRPNLKEVMELDDVYNYTSPGYKPDGTALHHAFHKSSILQIVSARSRPDAFRAPESIENPEDSHPGLVAIRVARVGLLWRKDPKKKRARSPWQEWGAVLTGSQLYFFRDVTWVKTLIAQYENAQKLGRRHGVTFKPPLTDFKPDAIMSTEEAVVLQDASYKRHKHAFLLVRHGGLEEVFLANSELEMNEWMATINYAAAFRTMGVNMRGMIGGQFQGPFETERDRIQKEEDRKDRESGLLPERSIEHDIEFERAAVGGETHSNASSAVLPTDKVLRRARKVDPGLVEEVSVARRELISSRIREADHKMDEAQKSLESLLRNARHLQILTPVHPRARDMVLLAAGRIAAKIKWARMDIWRTKCYRDILAVDLMDDERQSRSFDRAKPLEMVEKEEKEEEEECEKVRSTCSSRPSTADRQNGSNERRRPSSRRSVCSLPAGSSFGRRYHTRRSSASGQRQSLDDGSEFDAVALRRATSDSQRHSTQFGDTMNMSQPPLPLSDWKQAISAFEPHESAHIYSPVTSPPCETTSPVSHVTSHSPALPHAVDIQPRTSVGKNKKPHRSIQKTLRDAQYNVLPSRPSRKASSASNSHGISKGDTDGKDKPALSRRPGSFTVHGKKASVVTFGPQWQGLSPEEGLKMRKPSNQVTPQNTNEPASPVSAADPDFVSALGSPDPSYRSGHSRTSSVQSCAIDDVMATPPARENGLAFMTSHSRNPSRGMSDSELDTIRGRLRSPRIKELNLPLSLVAGMPPDSATGSFMPPEALEQTTPKAKPSSRPSSFPLIDTNTSSQSGSTVRLVRDDDDYVHGSSEPGPAIRDDGTHVNDDSAIDTTTSEDSSLHTARESPFMAHVSEGKAEVCAFLARNTDTDL